MTQEDDPIETVIEYEDLSPEGKAIVDLIDAEMADNHRGYTAQDF